MSGPTLPRCNVRGIEQQAKLRDPFAQFLKAVTGGGLRPQKANDLIELVYWFLEDFLKKGGSAKILSDEQAAVTVAGWAFDPPPSDAMAIPNVAKLIAAAAAKKAKEIAFDASEETVDGLFPAGAEIKFDNVRPVETSLSVAASEAVALFAGRFEDSGEMSPSTFLRALVEWAADPDPAIAKEALAFFSKAGNSEITHEMMPHFKGPAATDEESETFLNGVFFRGYAYARDISALSVAITTIDGPADRTPVQAF